MFSKALISVGFSEEVARTRVQTPTAGHSSSSSSSSSPSSTHHKNQAPLQSDIGSPSDDTGDDFEGSLLDFDNEPAALSLEPESSAMVSTNTTSSGNAFWPRPISLANFSPGLPLRVPSYSNPSSAFPSWMLGQPSPITFTTNSANARPRRKHARKNSWYTLRHHHHHHHHHRRHSSADGSQHMARSPMMAHEKMAQGTSDVLDDMALQKKSSNKLLCLWPLPIVTRCVIALSLIVSAMNFWGAIELSCSSPSYVIYRLEVGNLLLSPFFIAKSLHSLLLFGWNILILGLFEESLAHILGGTRPFVEVLVSIVLGVCTARQGIGYVFSKSTGFAVPRLFFSDSLHECSQGLAPFLFALLVIESLSIEDKYILMIGSNVKITVRKFVLQLVMLLVNYMVKNILWWSLTGLLIGSIVMVIIKTCLAWHPRAIDVDGALDEENDAATIIDGNVDFVYVRRRARTPLWREMWAAIKNGMMVVSITLLLLILFNAYYTRETYVDPTTLNSMTHDRYMFTFVVMTAPRRGDPPYLSRTLDSYLANWPVDPEAGSLYDRTQAIVYTHFTNHTEFDLAKARFSNDLRGQQYLKWVRQDGNTFDQRLHVSKALSLAADNFQSTYVALIEDDFPICGENEWRQMQNVIYAANQRVPGHCGVFVGTGGSGLFIKPKVARLASRLLLKYDAMPPDIVLQQCVAGLLPECGECSQTLVTSKTLLMYHIGYNTSTSDDRTYKKHDFQCGWRHPFNGDPNVITL